MAKKCIICGEEAKYQIKHSSEFYCKECATEHFDDLSVLLSVEEQARKIKHMIEERTKDEQTGDE